MRVLISNDDGIEAPGIAALREALESLDFVREIYLAAPEQERSATGHGITMHKPLRANPVKYADSRVQGWAINGTPADCVKLALDALLPEKPDLVLSGINKGCNLGTDILYSGTVSAALEGAIHGYPAIAFSHVSFSCMDFSQAGAFAAKLISYIQQKGWQWSNGTLLNVNIPDCPQPAGLKVTRLAKRIYVDAFDRRIDPRGQQYFWMAGRPLELDESKAATDVNLSRQGYITLTPVQVDLTAYEEIEATKQLEQNFF